MSNEYSKTVPILSKLHDLAACSMQLNINLGHQFLVSVHIFNTIPRTFSLHIFCICSTNKRPQMDRRTGKIFFEFESFDKMGEVVLQSTRIII